MAANKQQKVYLIPEGETRDSHTYHYTVVKTKKFIQENEKLKIKKFNQHFLYNSYAKIILG